MSMVGDSSGDRGLYLVRPGLDSVPSLLFDTPFDEIEPSISPDGRWLAYTSNETGEEQVYVRPFPDVNASRAQVSQGVSFDPVWTRGGRELLYTRFSPDAGTADIVSARVVAGATFSFDNEQVLFTRPFAYRGVSADGERFALVIGSESFAKVVLVENWFQELKAKVP